MTEPRDDSHEQQEAGTDDVGANGPLEVPQLLDPAEDGLPTPDRSRHGGMPVVGDDELALLAARERVAAGLQDYVPEDVPPAADPLPEDSAEAADLAQRGLPDDEPLH
jgi:hypothetical protein